MAKTRQKKSHILLVDDEKALLLAFKKFLQSPKINVDTAETFNEVKSMLEKKVYDVIITDLRLTGTSKEEGLNIINMTKEKNPETQVILLTAYGNQEIMEKAYQLGAAYYFEKPVSVNVLKEALMNLGVM
ncbi:MAG: response regulator [Nitrospirae bacterium]|nr:response regulator [Nitrospirota bacterium]